MPPTASSIGNTSGEQNLTQVQGHPLSTGAGLTDASNTTVMYIAMYFIQ